MRMLERYSHIRVAAKRAAIEALESRNEKPSPQKSPQFAGISEEESEPISEKVLN